MPFFKFPLGPSEVLRHCLGDPGRSVEPALLVQQSKRELLLPPLLLLLPPLLLLLPPLLLLQPLLLASC